MRRDEVGLLDEPHVQVQPERDHAKGDQACSVGNKQGDSGEYTSMAL